MPAAASRRGHGYSSQAGGAEGSGAAVPGYQAYCAGGSVAAKARLAAAGGVAGSVSGATSSSAAGGAPKVDVACLGGGILADFVKVRTIGRGTFGEALLVQHKGTGRECVLKRVRVDAKDIGNDGAVREAEVLKRLRHPHIVEFLGAIPDPREEAHGTVCLLMAFCEGGDLQKRIALTRAEGKHIKERVVMRWFDQICTAIAYLHSEQVLHRDIKPSNIFLTSNGADDSSADEQMVALGDFGVSRPLTHALELATTMVGTPCYLSPEVCRGKPYSYKSDIWSIGCVLFEMMTLRPPFGAAPNLEVLVSRIVKANYTMPGGCAEEYPEGMRCVRQILVLNPDRRPTAQGLVSRGSKMTHSTPSESVSKVVRQVSGGGPGDVCRRRQSKDGSPTPNSNPSGRAAMFPVTTAAMVGALSPRSRLQSGPSHYVNCVAGPLQRRKESRSEEPRAVDFARSPRCDVVKAAAGTGLRRNSSRVLGAVHAKEIPPQLALTRGDTDVLGHLPRSALVDHRVRRFVSAGNLAYVVNDDAQSQLRRISSGNGSAAPLGSPEVSSRPRPLGNLSPRQRILKGVSDGIFNSPRSSPETVNVQSPRSPGDFQVRGASPTTPSSPTRSPRGRAGGSPICSSVLNDDGLMSSFGYEQSSPDRDDRGPQGNGHSVLVEDAKHRQQRRDERNQNRQGFRQWLKQQNFEKRDVVGHGGVARAEIYCPGYQPIISTDVGGITDRSSHRVSYAQSSVSEHQTCVGCEITAAQRSVGSETTVAQGSGSEASIVDFSNGEPSACSSTCSIATQGPSMAEGNASHGKLGNGVPVPAGRDIVPPCAPVRRPLLSTTASPVPRPREIIDSLTNLATKAAGSPNWRQSCISGLEASECHMFGTKVDIAIQSITSADGKASGNDSTRGSSIGDRIEVIRACLEARMGVDRFQRLYRMLSECRGDSDAPSMSACYDSADEHDALAPLVAQLVACENSYFS